MKKISLKKYFERVFQERDDRYQHRFDSSEAAVKAAFLASEKAIEKAEVSQTAYNARSNEFRAALDDQAKLMLSRTEADARFGQLRDLIDVQAKTIVALQLQDSQGEGGTKATAASKTNLQAILGLAVGLAGLVIAAISIWASRP